MNAHYRNQECHVDERGDGRRGGVGQVEGQVGRLDRGKYDKMPGSLYYSKLVLGLPAGC